MKKITRLLLFAMLITAVSCSQQEDEIFDVAQEGAITDQNPAVLEKIQEMGYKLEEIEEIDDFYLVQGDILFSKKIADYENSNGRHATTNNLVTWNRAYTIRVDGSIPNSGTDNWRAATQTAVNDWNNVSGTDVNLVYTTAATADITVRSGQLSNGTIASAGFPTNGNPFNTILVNLSFNGNMNVSEAGKRYNMVHEIGHAIGFRHTNWDSRGEGSGSVGANVVNCFPYQDAGSVMNGGTALNTWAGFSVYDEAALRSMYSDENYNLRLDYVTTYESDSWDDDILEEDIFIDLFIPGSTTVRYNLQSRRTVTYAIRTRDTAGPWPRGPGVLRYYTRVLNPGSSRYYLTNIDTRDCSYDYGNPVGNCPEQYVECLELY